jgi:ribulose kinase
MLWLKNHMPASTFSKCMFCDLPDWLTYRATGELPLSPAGTLTKSPSPISSKNALFQPSLPSTPGGSSGSLQMLWLKNHMPASTFSKCMFCDLPDWLTYRR